MYGGEMSVQQDEPTRSPELFPNNPNNHIIFH